MVVITSAATTATHGLSPSVSPFVLPSSATALPMTKPATPYMSNCASDTIPPYADRKISVEAANPRMSARVITNSTKNCEPNVGSAISTTRIATMHRGADGRAANGAHSALPNNPFGRTARTSASSTNVRMIE